MSQKNAERAINFGAGPGKLPEEVSELELINNAHGNWIFL